MSKFGNEMTFEVTSNCLLLRVLNDAKTVFLTFRFGDAFFEKYRVINENEMIVQILTRFRRKVVEIEI